MKKNWAAVIMAGGSGTRFWPKSSKKLPKQFLSLVDKKSMIQLTRDRLTKIIQKNNVSVVSPKEFVPLIKKHLGAKTKITVEPEARNTMAAVCLAAWSSPSDDTILAVLPSDAHIANSKAYCDALRQCYTMAEASDVIVCLGIKPTFPATGYGYIKVGALLNKGSYRIESFVEKPNAERANEFFRSGQYLWNAGIFVFKVKTFKEQVKLHAPHYFKIFENSKKSNLVARFKKLPKEPVDTALMEKIACGALVTGDFGWNDVGSWPSLAEVLAANSEAGLIRTPGPYLTVESSGIIADMSSKKLLGFVGVHNLIVVETKDAILICSKDKAQEIKTLVGEIQKNKKLNRFS